MQFAHYQLCDRKPFSRKNGDGFTPVTAFEKPATSKGPKLYIVQKRGKVLYVGITCQSITNRLRYGFQAKGRGGYYGYKWKGIKGNLDLMIWYFPGASPKSIETVEAEVVFAIRQTTGAWPSFQTEIHFRKASKKESKLADLVCQEILK